MQLFSSGCREGTWKSKNDAWSRHSEAAGFSQVCVLQIKLSLFGAVQTILSGWPVCTIFSQYYEENCLNEANELLLLLSCESGQCGDCQINVWSKNILELCSGFHRLLDIPGMLLPFLERVTVFHLYLITMAFVGTCMYILLKQWYV